MTPVDPVIAISLMPNRRRSPSDRDMRGPPP
jgi:hypothetical protein